MKSLGRFNLWCRVRAFLRAEEFIDNLKGERYGAYHSASWLEPTPTAANSTLAGLFSRAHFSTILAQSSMTQTKGAV